MTTKQNAINLAKTARECASMANSVSGTIKSIVIHWNLACQAAKMEGFTTEARYTRRALLAADMLRMAAQLDNISEGKDALTGEPVAPAKKVKTIKACDLKVGDIFVNQSYGGELKVSGVMGSLTGRKEIHISFEIGGGTSYPDNCNITILDMDAIHAEALEENDARNTLYVYAPGDAAREVWSQMTPVEQSVSVELRHAEALIENEEFDGIIRDGLTPEQRAIQTRREGMDIYGERFAEMYAQDFAEALDINELVSIGADVPLYAPHLIIKRQAGGYALHVSDITPKTTLNPLAASFWDVMPGDPISERESRSKMRQFMREGDTITTVGEAIKETMTFALGRNWIEIVRRWGMGK